MKRLILIAALLLTPSLALAQGLAVSVPNAGTTGTTLNSLAKLTGAPSTAVKTVTTDTSGAEGIVVSGAGTSGNALILKAGQPSCNFDGATTAGDWVQISGTTAGDCHDAGSVFPVTGQVIGRVLSTNGASGLYPVNVGGGAQGNAVANGGTGGGTGAAAAKNLSVPYSVCTPTLTPLTGTTSETVVASCTIPANLLGTHGVLQFYFLGHETGSTNSKTWKVYFSATNNLAGSLCNTVTVSTASFIAGQLNGIVYANGATNSQDCVSSSGAGSSLNTFTDVATTIDTTANSFIVVSGTLASSGETLTPVNLVVTYTPPGGN